MLDFYLFLTFNYRTLTTTLKTNKQINKKTNNNNNNKAFPLTLEYKTGYPQKGLEKSCENHFQIHFMTFHIICNVLNFMKILVTKLLKEFLILNLS